MGSHTFRSRYPYGHTLGCGYFWCHRLGNGHLGSHRLGCRAIENTYLQRVGGDFEGVGSEGTKRGPLAPWLAATSLEGKERAGWHSDFLCRWRE